MPDPRSEPRQSIADPAERLTAALCLKNAHGHIATAYAQIGNPVLDSPARRDRMVRETLDAVDWIRRALEHMEKAA